MAPELALGNGDIDSLAISPLRELGAYEAMWDNPGVSFKTISEKFAARPGALPSDFVSPKKAGEYADFVRKRFHEAHIDRFGVRVHGAGEYPEKLRDAAHPVELIYYQGWWDLAESRCVAVVGARRPSEEGLARTRRLVRELVKDNFTVVSGLAAGVDAAAHETDNWKGGGTVEGSRSLSVMKMARAGFLSGRQLGSWQWTNRDDISATIQIVGEGTSVTLHYRIRAGDEEWQPVHQRVPIRWTPCRFGGERPWFVCDVHSNGVYCGRQVTKLYGGGRLFACRHCYRLGYAVQRDGPMDRAHHHLRRLHRKLRADYDGPDGIPPRRPKWMRFRTYDRVVQQIEAGEEHLDHVFMVGAQRIFARIDKLERRGGMRR